MEDYSASETKPARAQKELNIKRQLIGSRMPNIKGSQIGNFPNTLITYTIVCAGIEVQLACDFSSPKKFFSSKKVRVAKSVASLVMTSQGIRRLMVSSVTFTVAHNPVGMSTSLKNHSHCFIQDVKFLMGASSS